MTVNATMTIWVVVNFALARFMFFSPFTAEARPTFSDTKTKIPWGRILLTIYTISGVRAIGQNRPLYSSPNSRPRRAAWVRSRTPILPRMLVT